MISERRLYPLGMNMRSSNSIASFLIFHLFNEFVNSGPVRLGFRLDVQCVNMALPFVSGFCSHLILSTNSLGDNSVSLVVSKCASPFDVSSLCSFLLLQMFEGELDALCVFHTSLLGINEDFKKKIIDGYYQDKAWKRIVEQIISNEPLARTPPPYLSFGTSAL